MAADLHKLPQCQASVHTENGTKLDADNDKA